MGSLQLDNLAIRYGSETIFSEFSLTVNNGELLSLLGPSGVGKTSLLKTIAGFTRPDSGTIHINSQEVTHLPAEKRDLVLLFQKPLLFPYLTVFDNVSFGLKIQKVPPGELKQRTIIAMERTEISNLGKKMPNDLSGGQQQRVAIARALILQPSILLLDEPFSSLDTDLRHKMQSLVRTLQKETGTTMLFVTHDQSEAFAISDRIALLIDGKLEQIDTPKRLLSSPNNSRVASFFGNTNILLGRIEGGTFVSGKLQIPVDQGDTSPCSATIRPEDILLLKDRTPHSVSAIVSESRFEGAVTRLTVQLEQHTFSVLCLTNAPIPGQKIWLTFPPDKIHFFKP